jgi:hypothetical protein
VCRVLVPKCPCCCAFVCPRVFAGPARAQCAPHGHTKCRGVGWSPPLIVIVVFGLYYIYCRQLFSVRISCVPFRHAEADSNYFKDRLSFLSSVRIYIYYLPDRPRTTALLTGVRHHQPGRTDTRTSADVLVPRLAALPGFPSSSHPISYLTRDP